ncbi:hypothetical protein MNV49_001317 [Pseudohyphozyma bogoriensis]|nr:hypothetical protein MNV49_001317 [Pseudohyphozyma bogoriensis]
MSVDPSVDVPGWLAKQSIATGITGPFFVSWEAQVLLAGMTVPIVYQYASRGRFSRDPLGVKIFQVAVFVSNVGVAVLALESIFYWGVMQTRTANGLWRLTMVECLLPLFVGITGALVQSWFARRTSLLFEKELWGRLYLAVLGVLIVVSFAGSIMTTAEDIRDLYDPEDAASNLFRISFSLWLMTSAFIDVVNSATLCYLLKKTVAGFNSRTDGVLNQMIKLAIETGSYTAIIAVIGAILDLTLDLNSYYVGGVPYVFFTPLPSLYTLSLFTTLGSRDRLADEFGGTADVSSWRHNNSTTHRLSFRPAGQIEESRVMVKVEVEKAVDEGEGDVEMLKMGSFLSRAPEHSTASLQGKTYVVTGGATGLGIHITLNLLLRGARVLVCSRSSTNAIAALSQLSVDHPTIKKEKWEFFEADFGSIEGAKAAAREVVARVGDGRLDGVVNNAGRMASDFVITKDGIEMSSSVNYVGPWVFTNELLPLLKRSAEQSGEPARVITTGASSYNSAPPLPLTSPTTAFADPGTTNPAKLNSFNVKFKRYSISKGWGQLWNSELQRGLDREGDRGKVISMIVHPGVVGTEQRFPDGAFAMLPSTLFFRLVRAYVFPLIGVTPSQGAYASLWALTDPEVSAQPDRYGGKYLVPWKKLEAVTKEWSDEERAKELWRLTEELVQSQPK